MAEFKCSGDCIQCGPSQRIYCAAQRTHAILEMQQSMLALLTEVRDLLKREDAVTPIKDAAGTKDAGADNRALESNI